MVKKASRKSQVPRVRGQGGYYTDNVVPFMKKVFPDGTFEKAGGNIGRAVGAATGVAPLAAPSGMLGALMGRKIAKIVGFGDYEVTSNVLSTVGKAISPGESVPDFGTMGNATRVRHREYIGDVTVPATPAAFTNTSYTINPGDSVTFPWLSAIAAQYQQYKFNGLIFEFKSLTSDYALSGPLGAVVLATNYDVLEASFPDKIRMENSQFAVSAKPSFSQIHTVECAPSESASRLLYIRDQSSSVTASQDARWSDLGKFQLATQGLPGTTGDVLGELWVSFDVTLYKPEIALPFAVSTKVAGAGSVSKTSIFGLTPTITGDPIVSALGSVLTFLVTGQFMISLSLSTTGGAAASESHTVSQLTVISAAISAGDIEEVVLVDVTAPGQSITFDFSASTTVIGTNARIGRYDYSLL